jgi:hypothetical protein
MVSISTREDEGRADQLKVFIDTKSAMPALQAARLLTAFDRAFSIYAQEKGYADLHLQVISSGNGSWWIIFEQLGAAYGISTQYPDLIPLFVNDMQVIAKILQEQGPEETPKYMRDLLEDLAKVGKRTAAKSITLINIISVIFSQDTLDHIDFIRRQRNGRVKAEYAATFKADAGTPKLSPVLVDKAAVIRAAGLAEQWQLHGKLFKIEGEWFAKPADMHGILLPLKLKVLPKLVVEDRKTYRIGGSLMRSIEGYPIGIDVTDLELAD